MLDRRNILFIAACPWRAGRTGHAGYRLANTPNLHQMAARTELMAEGAVRAASDA